MARFYVLHLNPDARGITDRYAVMYLTDEGALSPLWGHLGDRSVSDDPRKAAKAWPYMVYVSRPTSGPDRFPAFHFAVKGGGFNKLLALAEALSLKLGEPVELYPVTGWNSSATRWPQA